MYNSPQTVNFNLKGSNTYSWTWYQPEGVKHEAATSSCWPPLRRSDLVLLSHCQSSKEWLHTLVNHTGLNHTRRPTPNTQIIWGDATMLFYQRPLSGTWVKLLVFGHKTSGPKDKKKRCLFHSSVECNSLSVWKSTELSSLSKWKLWEVIINCHAELLYEGKVECEQEQKIRVLKSLWILVWRWRIQCFCNCRYLRRVACFFNVLEALSDCLKKGVLKENTLLLLTLAQVNKLVLTCF